MKKKRVLITGGLGYVGGRLTAHFGNKKEYLVYALSRNKSLENKTENIIVYTNNDVLKEGKLDGVKIDLIIHLAAMNEHDCVNLPQEAIDVNIKGTVEWLIWAHKNQVKQFIYFSTAHVYAKPLVGRFNEESNAFPVHPYSITHKAAEDYVLSYFYEHNLNSSVVRLSNSFGYPAFSTANRWTLLINDICRNIVNKRKFQIYSNSLQERDFISLKNVCSAVDALIDYDFVKTDNRIFNVCSSESKTLLSVGLWVKGIAEDYLNETIEFEYKVNKSEKIEPLNLSNEKLKNIGWSPNTEYDKLEIEKTLDFFKNY
ncbi:hypothetical protein BTO04_06455 [Polaribacter sp. SA4-10]|uniref:SDR family oxidoreductase n=1 Tax=Polaribacter sp. SA4-10 TaxID=754397 RepID=UPI000B3D21DC|nr:SDR family oxidoreductase [Polaribacter sp. SA4-10]ARV06364.1 hypothetical protein BTO04_06455 [Polaribacter sp. SA4-10]